MGAQVVTRKARKPRAPRNPQTRRTRLAPGQEYQVPADGRVKRADYRLYMKSAAWRARRARWWDEAGQPGACAACERPWSLGSGHLHHVTYDRLGSEAHGDLVQLCKHCHAYVHSRVKRWAELESVTGRAIGEIRKGRGLA